MKEKIKQLKDDLDLMLEMYDENNQDDRKTMEVEVSKIQEEITRLKETDVFFTGTFGRMDTRLIMRITPDMVKCINAITLGRFIALDKCGKITNAAENFNKPSYMGLYTNIKQLFSE